ncbi:hypothetical protein QJS10_CPB11g02027 [Acorus calamus]|uniref:Uncharacterized protein n=1 Tax=Acorus calamus TaxID=4465 RepID=A0AAV9DW95_ACOCL|nr:hypothetical protein QJS10_CPB11g02027 [Acorus calamus]
MAARRSAILFSRNCATRSSSLNLLNGLASGDSSAAVSAARLAFSTSSSSSVQPQIQVESREFLSSKPKDCLASGDSSAAVSAAAFLSAKPKGRPACHLDTLALVRRLEGQGVPSKQAEAITAAIAEVLNDSLDIGSQSFVARVEMQKAEMVQDSNFGKFKSEVKNSQEHHFSLLQRETEKLRVDIDKLQSELRSLLQRETEKFRVDLDKLRSESRYEIDKVTAGQRLDLNLERGRMRDELANQNAETTNLTNKLDKEIHTLRAHLEMTKYDIVKWCVATLVALSSAGIAVLRIMM